MTFDPRRSLALLPFRLCGCLSPPFCLDAPTTRMQCWGMNALGALGLGDTLDRGDGPDEMGDALPAVSLGTGVTVAADAGAVIATLVPTPAVSSNVSIESVSWT